MGSIRATSCSSVMAAAGHSMPAPWGRNGVVDSNRGHSTGARKFSAIGMLLAVARIDTSKTFVSLLNDNSIGALGEIFGAMEK